MNDNTNDFDNLPSLPNAEEGVTAKAGKDGAEDFYSEAEFSTEVAIPLANAEGSLQLVYQALNNRDRETALEHMALARKDIGASMEALSGTLIGDMETFKNEELLQDMGWPAALARATHDTFTFFAYHESLGWISFSFAEYVSREWVRLYTDDLTIRKELYPCPRGVEVRLSDIRCVIDCPEGT